MIPTSTNIVGLIRRNREVGTSIPPCGLRRTKCGQATSDRWPSCPYTTSSINRSMGTSMSCTTNCSRHIFFMAGLRGLHQRDVRWHCPAKQVAEPSLVRERNNIASPRRCLWCGGGSTHGGNLSTTSSPLWPGNHPVRGCRIFLNQGQCRCTWPLTLLESQKSASMIYPYQRVCKPFHKLSRLLLH